jgi:hypothetical protein
VEEDGVGGGVVGVGDLHFVEYVNMHRCIYFVKE